MLRARSRRGPMETFTKLSGGLSTSSISCVTRMGFIPLAHPFARRIKRCVPEGCCPTAEAARSPSAPAAFRLIAEADRSLALNANSQSVH